MREKRIGICTLFTGYNYGSALQAYSLKKFIELNNFQCDIIKLSGSLIEGRDFRINKAIISFYRMLFFSKNKKNVIKSFSINNKNNINENTIKLFDKFYLEYIDPVYYGYNNLKRISKTEYYKAFLCGSDQIWNSTAFYVDPFYYLDFSPREKRISYAPSFGRDFLPNYNKRIIGKLLSGFNNISVREETGKRIIKELTNKDAVVCLDPTFLFNHMEWRRFFNLNDKKEKVRSYILAYFLNEPSIKAKEFMEKLSSNNEMPIIYIGSGTNNDNYAGPKEFLDYINNSSYIVTDSFHGVAFSIIFNKNFWAFDRNYVTENQSTRITGLLRKMDLSSRFEPQIQEINNRIDYHKTNLLLEKEKKASINYLKNELENYYEK